MTAFASLESVIPRILKNISFKEYLLSIGYQHLKNRDVKGFEVFKKDSVLCILDIVFVGNYKGKEIFYSLTYSDQGNIIDFVKNRIEIIRDQDYDTFEPTKDHLIEACKKLVEYINKNGENQTKLNLDTSEIEIDDLKAKTFTKFFKTQNIYDYEYLNEFKLNQAVINHPIFINTIFNSKGLIFNEKELDNINTAFPLVNESGKECGLYFETLIKNKNKSEEIKFFAPGSVETGIWFSNNFQEDKKLRSKITIVSSPKEALAHFSNLKENRYYLSVFKQDETTYSHIKSVLNRQRSSLYLAGNVSMESFVNEIKIIVHVLNSKIKFIKESYENITLKVYKEEEKYFAKLMKLIKKYNTNKVGQLLQVFGDSAKDQLKNDLILLSLDPDENIIIKIPKSFKTLYHFEEILVKSFPSETEIKIEKPMYFDWVNQNKKLTSVVSVVNDKINSEDVVQKYIEEQKLFVLSN